MPSAIVACPCRDDKKSRHRDKAVTASFSLVAPGLPVVATTVVIYARSADAFLSGSIKSCAEKGLVRNARHPEATAALRMVGPRSR